MGAQRFAAVLFASVLAATTGQVAGRGAPSRFEPSPCPYPAADTILKHVSCGDVPVAEHRAIPDGRRLKLAVAILESLSPNPRADPVTVAGGLGEPFVGRAPSLTANGSMDVLRADRDIILCDQRGVVFSEPKFCPELAAEWTPGGFDTPAARRAYQRDIAAGYGKSMQPAGYDLSQYHTVVSARDSQNLRRALGVKSWNLHGRSYGSRLALIAMPVSPEGIRSAVLDGPLPRNRSKWFNMPGDFSDVLKRLSAACAAQPDCQGAFPDDEQTFWRTLDALQRDPFTRHQTRNGNTRTVRVTPARLAGGSHAAVERLQPAVPFLVHAMHARDAMRDFHDAPVQKVNVNWLKSIPRLRVVTNVSTPAPPVSAFESAPCPFKADAKVLEHVRCGYVTVPENRAAPEKRTLKLAVAIMKSLSATPRPDPIVVIGGGPGDSLVDRVAGYVSNGTMDAVRADRDVIVYDQRGVGHSEPKFCPEASAPIRSHVGSPADYRVLQRQQMARCGESMSGAGYDLSQYNSIASAHDLADLRRALGYPEWNLRAASYGTRLALVAMREAPQGIRSAVLEGPSPPNRAFWSSKPADFVEILGRLSAACAAQAPCNAAFPDVEKMFWRAVNQYERTPKALAVTLPDGTRVTRTLDAPIVAASIVRMVERGMYPVVPLAIHALTSGDEATLARLAQMLNSRPDPGETGSNWGLHYTVNCFEEAPLNTADLQKQARTTQSPLLTDGGLFPDPTVCEGLHSFRATAAQTQLVDSAIPTLILTGEFDLQTHRANGPLLAQSLKNSQVFDIPGAGHVQSWRHECTRTMMREFYNAPAQKIDGGCLKSIPAVQFLTSMPGIGR